MVNDMRGKRIKIWKAAAGIAGLALVFLLGAGLSSRIYDWEEDGPGPGGEIPLGTAVPALTEEEHEEWYRAMKDPGTGALSGTETGKASVAGGDSEEGGLLGAGGGAEKGGLLGAGENSGEDGSSAAGGTPETAGDPIAGENGETAGELSGEEIDFEYLWTINEDIYAWITIPGTNIDYPVLQHPTYDSFYLNHNVDGSYGYPSCIYTESVNSKDFTDPNTVLYGHNLKAKTMFTQLHKFESRDFFDENRDVYIYLPGQTLHYKIFAAYVYDDRHLMYSFDFWNEDVFADYLQSVYDIRDMSANIDREMTVTSEDRIITMATCMPKKADSEKRLLVQAVLIEEE